MPIYLHYPQIHPSPPSRQYSLSPTTVLAFDCKETAPEAYSLSQFVAPVRHRTPHNRDSIYSSYSSIPRLTRPITSISSICLAHIQKTASTRTTLDYSVVALSTPLRNLSFRHRGYTGRQTTGPESPNWHSFTGQQLRCRWRIGSAHR